MIKCPTCSAPVAEDARACPACGAPLDGEFSPTRLIDDERQPARIADERDEGGARARRAEPAASQVTSSQSLDGARFLPGTVLAGRYRVIALLGQGGMGEVYRADDLKLGQQVALKFLPSSLSRDEGALARLYREVRVARQISHPNVCRVYDAGEFEGQHFLSMEYIRGEELASTLKRFGRLPADKATEIAREVCAGLAAAHKSGVLHRDLKPANVMIDERGSARITDFGLAALAEEIKGADVYSGTPAYMSPEQLAGRGLTARSDIYSLGLVLYELYTGKRAFDAATLNDLLRLRQSDTTPTAPSAHIKDLDPLVERVIERCLKRDPEERPASALQVAAALPGGDPLAAALAMGETPSPEMVAAAPKEGALKPAVAASLVAAFAVTLALTCWLTRYVSLYRLASLDKSPEVLRARARDIVKELGYDAPALDSADGFALKEDYLDYVKARDPSPARWERLRTEAGPYRFWYRQSPRYFGTTEGISSDEPALNVSGMTLVYLDTGGRLHWFVGVPPQRDPTDAAQLVPPPDWSVLFREAGLDMASFQSVVSTWVPPQPADARAAWDGADPLRPEQKVHVEAASYRGRVVYFETIYPWDAPARQEQQPESAGDRAVALILIAVFATALVGAALLARRNVRLGRGDRRGATRVAAFFFAARLLKLFARHHNGLPVREFDLIFDTISVALFYGSFLWLLYVALEPFVRRRWPQRIISWSRLLAGGWRDPLVGRDVLVGAAFGGAMMLSDVLSCAGLRWLGRAPDLWYGPATLDLGTNLAERLLAHVTACLLLSFVSLFLLLLFVAVLRREGPALVALWLLVTVIQILLGRVHPLMIPFIALYALLAVFVLYRYGLLATVSAMFFFHLWVFYPVTTELTAWYATDFLVGLALCAALAAYAFYTSLAGQPLFKGGLLGE